MVELNKIQLKAEILMVIAKLQSMPNVEKVDELFVTLESQSDKIAIKDILLKELMKVHDEEKNYLIGYMLLRLFEKDELENSFWDIIKNSNTNDRTKQVVLNLLRDIGSRVCYDDYNQYFLNPNEIIDEDTRKLLDSAIVNPEAQIDFLDFLNSLNVDDQKMLIESLGEDYTQDALSNILVPVLMHKRNDEVALCALKVLSQTKSQFALHALLEIKDYVKDDILKEVKRGISSLKLAGIREDNTNEFYKSVLKNSSPYECYTSYPDGHGNQAIIFSRIDENDFIKMFATVINEDRIIDCFGFNEISEMDFHQILEKFYGKDKRVYINPTVVKTLFKKAQINTLINDLPIPYEYISWSSELKDISEEPVPFDMLVQPYVEEKSLTRDDIEQICFMDIVQNWFLDTDFSNEFKNFVDKLNVQFKENKFTLDFEKEIDLVLPNIFTDSTIKKWKSRIILSAYLKYLATEYDESSLLYNLYKDSAAQSELYKNIIRKSVYEYYVSQKFLMLEKEKTTNIFQLKNNKTETILNKDNIDFAIKLIEKMWVKNV